MRASLFALVTAFIIALPAHAEEPKEKEVQDNIVTAITAQIAAVKLMLGTLATQKSVDRLEKIMKATLEDLEKSITTSLELLIAKSNADLADKLKDLQERLKKVSVEIQGANAKSAQKIIDELTVIQTKLAAAASLERKSIAADLTKHISNTVEASTKATAQRIAKSEENVITALKAEIAKLAAELKKK